MLRGFTFSPNYTTHISFTYIIDKSFSIWLVLTLFSDNYILFKPITRQVDFIIHFVLLYGVVDAYLYLCVKYYSELIFNIPLCTSKLCAVDISNSFLWYDLPLCEFWVPVCYSCIEGLMRYTSKYVECAQAYYYIYVDSGVALLNGLWLLLNFGYYLRTMFSHCFQYLITGNVLQLNWIDVIGRLLVKYNETSLNISAFRFRAIFILRFLGSSKTASLMFS